MTIGASSTSWCWSASIVRSSEATTRSRPPSACSSRSLQLLLEVLPRAAGPSAELPGDVVLGALVPGFVKIWSVGPNSTSSPGQHERRRVRHARRLLHVVRDDHDRVALASARRSAPRSSASRSGRAPSTARPSGSPPAPPRSCARCTGAAAGRRRARRRAREPVLDLVPQRRRRAASARRARRCLMPRPPDRRGPAATLSKIDMVGNGLGFWKTMPIARRTATGSTSRP